MHLGYDIDQLGCMLLDLKTCTYGSWLLLSCHAFGAPELDSKCKGTRIIDAIKQGWFVE